LIIILTGIKKRARGNIEVGPSEKADLKGPTSGAREESKKQPRLFISRDC